MKKILITGAGGYIGSVSAHLFLDKGYEIVAIDNFSTGYRQPLELLQEKYGKEKIRYYDVDLQHDVSSVFEKEKDIEAAIHYAAFCSVNESMMHPVRYFKNNIYATLNLIENLTNNNIKNIVFSSTCAVYGDAHYIPIDEKHPILPTSPYGESKRMAEKIIEWYGTLKSINYIILRYFNVCGATEDGLIGDSKRPSPHLVQNAVRGALGIEPFFLTYQHFDSTPDRSPIRDYVNVVDLNEAHLKALDYLLSGGKSEIINIGTGTGNSVLEVIKQVEQTTGKKLDTEKGVARTGESDRMIASIEKAKNLLSWEPKRSTEDSIKSLVTWYTLHPKGWEK